MSIKQCQNCLKELEINSINFNFKKQNSDGFTNICKKCRSYIRNKNKHIKGDLLFCLKCKIFKEEIEFRNCPKKEYRKGKGNFCKNCVDAQALKRKQANRGNLTLKRLFVERYCGLRDRAVKNKLELDFKIDYLHELWEKQKSKCKISNINMTYIMGQGRIPTNVSIDRIDSNKGYIKNNIQLVCMAVNQMKSDLKIEELVYFCKEIINNYDKT
jgi:hypothetical protein